MGQNENTKMLSVLFNPESQSLWPNLGRMNRQVFTVQYESHLNRKPGVRHIWTGKWRTQLGC